MNRKSTTDFPIDGVGALPLKGVSKRFWNKVCYYISLCENFQRQSCNITIFHRY